MGQLHFLEECNAWSGQRCSAGIRIEQLHTQYVGADAAEAPDFELAEMMAIPATSVHQPAQKVTQCSEESW